MVRDINIDLWHSTFVLGGFSQASNVPVVQYLLMASLQQCHSNSDLRDIKI